MPGAKSAAPSMRVLLLFFFFCSPLLADSSLLQCQNNTIFLNEENSTWTLPPGEYAENQKCLIDILFPEETYVELELKATKGAPYLFEWIYAIDSFNHSLTVLTGKNKIYFGKNLRLVIQADNQFYKKWFNINYTIKHFIIRHLTVTLHSFAPFNKTEYYPIMAGSEHLLIDTNTLKIGVTYIFEGFPNLAVVFLTNDEETTITIGEKMFVYGGTPENFTSLGSVSSWKGVQYFNRISLYVAGSLDDARITKAEYELLLFMDPRSLSGFVNPVFFQANVMLNDNVTLDASNGISTFATITQYEQQIIEYDPFKYVTQVKEFIPSSDVELVLLNGYAKLDFNETEVIERFTASTLTKDLIMLLARTKSLVLLKGTLSMKLVDLSNIPYYKEQTFFVKGEEDYPAVIKWKLGESSLQYFHLNSSIERDNIASDLSLNITTNRYLNGENYSVQLQKGSPNLTEYWEADGTAFDITFKGNGIARLTFTLTDQPTTTLPSTTTSVVCPHFRVFECFNAS